jgi:hypothetical protein
MFLQRAIVPSWVVHRWKGLQATCSSGRRELLSCMRAMPLQVIGCVAQLHRAKLLGNCDAKRRPIKDFVSCNRRFSKMRDDNGMHISKGCRPQLSRNPEPIYLKQGCNHHRQAEAKATSVVSCTRSTRPTRTARLPPCSWECCSIGPALPLINRRIERVCQL